MRRFFVYKVSNAHLKQLHGMSYENEDTVESASGLGGD